MFKYRSVIILPHDFTTYKIKCKQTNFFPPKFCEVGPIAHHAATDFAISVAVIIGVLEVSEHWQAENQLDLITVHHTHPYRPWVGGYSVVQMIHEYFPIAKCLWMQSRVWSLNYLLSIAVSSEVTQVVITHYIHINTFNKAYKLFKVISIDCICNISISPTNS